MEIPSISSITSKPVSTPENSTDQDKHFNLLVSHGNNGNDPVYELCSTTGNISSGLISNLDDAKNIMANSEERYHIAQQDPNLPNHLKLII